MRELDIEGRRAQVHISDDKTISLISLASSSLIKSFKSQFARVTDFEAGMINGIPILVTGATDGSVRVFELNGCIEILDINAHAGWTLRARLMTIKGRNFIVSSGWDGTLQVRDFVTGALRFAAAGKFVGVLHLWGDEEQGYRIVSDYPEAWRDWRASYEIDGVGYETEIDDMPRDASYVAG